MSLHATIRKGHPVVVTAYDRDGHVARTEGAIPELAQNRPATQESVIRVLSKLGGTIFRADSITAEVEDELMVPVAALNACRRDVCEKINALRSCISAVPVSQQSLKLSPDLGASAAPPVIRARFARYSQISDAALSVAACFSLPIEEVVRHKEELAAFRDRVMIELPRLLFGREQDILDSLRVLCRDGFRNVVCENIAHIALAKQCGMVLHGGVFLNCTNSLSAQWLSGQGVSSLTLSFEMRARDIANMKTAVPRGVISCGRLPLMLWRNCPAKTEKGCAGCDRQQVLTDRLGKVFPVFCMRPFGAAMLNSEMLWTADKTRDFGRIAFVTCYFTTESAAVCADILFRQKEGEKLSGTFTRGLYYRSI